LSNFLIFLLLKFNIQDLSILENIWNYLLFWK